MLLPMSFSLRGLECFYQLRDENLDLSPRSCSVRPPLGRGLCDSSMLRGALRPRLPARDCSAKSSS